MLPFLPVQKTQNKLATWSLVLILCSVLAAALLHFFSYVFPGALNGTLLSLFITVPMVVGGIGIVLGIVSLRQIMNNNYFGKAKAITGIVFGCLVLVGLVVFLVLQFL